MFETKEMLPKVDLVYDTEIDDIKKEYFFSNTQSYQELQNMIKDYVGADCWAITVNDEIVFNSYLDNSKHIRRFIEEDVIRDKILEDPHGNLLVYIHRRKANARIRIYMLNIYSWTINIDYVFNEKKFLISYSQSEEFKRLITNHMREI